MGHILWFEEVGKGNIGQVGGKNASLGELIKAGVKVPPGFAVTTMAYKEFLRETGIEERVGEILSSLDVEETEALQKASEEIRRLIEGASLPGGIRESIEKGYRELCRRLRTERVPVAVRSSATAEDLPTASFAGQQDTYLWVEGTEEVTKKVMKCWGSLFTPRAIAYRVKMGFPHEKVAISVGVQKMVNAKAAGVMFTLDPTTGDPSKVVIEGSWGLGEAVEEGVRELANLAKRIEDYYGGPQDIEWSIDREIPFPENVFIVQSRPETVWSQKRKEPVLGKKTGFELLMERAMTRIKVTKG